MPRFLDARFTLKAYDSNGVLFRDYTKEPDLKLVVTDTCNGGYKTCTFELCDYANKLPPLGYRLIMRDETLDKYIFEGLVAKPYIKVSTSAQIEATGHGFLSSTFLRYIKPDPTTGVISQKWIAGTPLATLFSDTLNLCQMIFAGTMTDLSGIQLAEDSKDYKGNSPYEVWNDVVAMLSSLSTPFQWFVRDLLGVPSLSTRFQDLAARYRVVWDKKKATLESSFDLESIINACSVEFGQGLIRTSPNPLVRSHVALPTNTDRDKYISVNNEVSGSSEAQALADNILARFQDLKPIQSTIVICGQDITAIPPIVPDTDTDYPWWLVESGWAIEVQNQPGGQAPYAVDTFFIVEAKKDFTSGTLTLTCGEIVNFGTAVRLINNFQMSRLSDATLISPQAVNLTNRDETDYIGPPALGTLPTENDNTAGIPSYIKNDTVQDPDNQLYLPFKAGINPQTIPDYGTQANFGREADSIGIKGFIQLVPQKLLTWTIEFIPPTGSDTIPTDSITIEFYSTYPFTPGSPFATKSVTTDTGATGTFTGTEQQTFASGGRVGIRVSSAATFTAGCGFIVAVGGRKLYPDLGITT